MSQKTIRLTLSYDGTDFHGFQAQPGLRTVQGEVERVLSKLTGEEIRFFGSGRTDAGVHALGQVGHFVTQSPIPVEKMAYILNMHLPSDIVAREAREVPPGFHARYDATGKTYVYLLARGTQPHIFLRRYSWHLRQELDLPAMREGARHLIGTHDFTSFCAAQTPLADRVRTITELAVEPLVLWDYPLWQIRVSGNGFLYNMVRIIAGTLVEVGMGKRRPEEVKAILEARDRTAAGLTAPPQGLILWKVQYSRSAHGT